MLDSAGIPVLYELTSKDVNDFSPYFLAWYKSGHKIFGWMDKSGKLIGLSSYKLSFYYREIVIKDCIIRLTTMKG